MAPESLSPQQAEALFDILTHHATYQEIQAYKYPSAIERYGPPFDVDQIDGSESPILQTLLNRFVLTLPGLQNVGQDFWQNRIEELVKKFGDADLSESYDKATIGSRKTLATAISVLIEYPARGVLGGMPRQKPNLAENNYDIADPEDIHHGFNDFLQDLVYGDAVGKLAKKIGETDQLSEQSLRVQAAHEFILINLASFLHYIMILSPDGPYLARVLENVHRLVPYAMMRSTLRVGNAATMISGMLKLLLTKMTVNSVTSFFGLTNYSDAGMNLLQQIASTVIGWDISELNKQTAKAEKAKDAPSKEHLDAIRNHMKEDRAVRDRRRQESEDHGKSIVQAIFDDLDIEKELDESHHGKAMDFLSLQLSIRDREQLCNILCNLQPDIMTQAIRDTIAAYDPIIRECHNAIDLSGTLFDLESFLTDLIKVSKPGGTSNGESSRPSTPRLVPSRPGTPKPGQSRRLGDDAGKNLPSVEDYIKLLRKHQGAAHKFLHQAFKNDQRLAEKWIDYASHAASQFRCTTSEPAASAIQSDAGAGDMTHALQSLFSNLSQEHRERVVEALDNFAAYKMALTAASRDRWTSVSSGNDRTSSGPGIYLAKWQKLLDATKISPATARGPVRTGKDKSVRDKAGLGIDMGASRDAARRIVERSEGYLPEEPDVGFVVELLGPGFKEVLQERGKRLWVKSDKSSLT